MPDSSRKHLLFAFRRVLLPLIRILVRAGVRYDEFVGLVRGVFVEAAALDGVGLDSTVKPSRARISVATGVPRAEVDRFVDSDGALPHIAQTFTNTLAKVLNTWHTDPQFVGPYGIPLELPRAGDAGHQEPRKDKGRNFADLVRAVDPSADPAEVCEELIRLDAIVTSGDTHLRVVSRAMIATKEMSPAQLELFGNSLTRLALTLQFNIDQRNVDKKIERSVIAERGVPVALLPEFQAHFRERVSALLTDLDDWITPRTDRPGPRTGAIGLAVFEFEDSAAALASLKNLVGGEAVDRHRALDRIERD
jgi:hypothetical protein